jgi:hypothetical protein
MSMNLDLLFSFHMFCVEFGQSSPQPGDPIPLLHHLPSPLYRLWLSSCYSFYIGKVLHCASFSLFQLSTLSGPLPS